jgi:hypothetical protein
MQSPRSSWCTITLPAFAVTGSKSSSTFVEFLRSEFTEERGAAKHRSEFGIWSYSWKARNEYKPASGLGSDLFRSSGWPHSSHCFRGRGLRRMRLEVVPAPITCGRSTDFPCLNLVSSPAGGASGVVDSLRIGADSSRLSCHRAQRVGFRWRCPARCMTAQGGRG